MSNNNHYYQGGFAEIVAHPSDLTYSYLKSWFTGKSSFGKAMELLQLPYEKIDLPILILENHRLRVDLFAEEQTLYKRTLYHYKRTSRLNQLPQLQLQIQKMLHPINIFKTARLVRAQADWIAHPERISTKLKRLRDNLPQSTEDDTSDILVKLLEEKYLPAVIAIGMVTEFYQQLLLQEVKNEEKLAGIEQYIAQKIAKEDWFFESLSAMEKVKSNHLSFESYLKTYGLRSDDDYELTTPRWIEIPEIIKKRIEEYTHPKETTLQPDKPAWKYTQTLIDFQLLRSDIKRATLPLLYALRKKLLSQNPDLFKTAAIHRNDPQRRTHTKTVGKGLGVAAGKAAGKAIFITTTTTAMQNACIGIFPNASPQYAMLYPQCLGIIFLRGGKTSHGAIVAREFGIPALIDEDALDIPNGETIQINGTTGEWRTL